VNVVVDPKVVEGGVYVVVGGTYVVVGGTYVVVGGTYGAAVEVEGV
jgi:hypothetical protein